MDFEWRAILQEAQSQNFAEKMYPQTDAPMREHLTKKEVSEYWPEIKEDWLDQRFESTDDELFFGTGEMPLWLGYSLAYYTGQKLLQQGYTLEEFPELEKEDVINAGDKLFD